MTSAWGIEHGEVSKSHEYKRDLHGRFATTGSNCKTPGSMYHTKIGSRQVTVGVDLPRDFDMNEKEAIRLENAIHDAMEKALGPLFDRKQP
jgi:hypothetical protein